METISEMKKNQKIIKGRLDIAEKRLVNLNTLEKKLSKMKTGRKQFLEGNKKNISLTTIKGLIYMQLGSQKKKRKIFQEVIDKKISKFT